ncbi:hypothetical protein EW145_g6064 [Phellinidium pouzarii]|uniref:tRNA dimethylallyltransferase n=1 Tax=Phellinidium pouzarii TaxID=167371 RepID=A0A4S4KYF3_9AGAM|nr:hypothetical protein EW145_g6064 [Phellinidium pouzarii]
MTLKPLIAICGTTGVGKSRLAIELALALPSSGKIINADAMQVYEGLDVLTNKVQISEQQGVEHLLMSFKKPDEQYFVGEWIKDAEREVDKIHAEGKVPIVVGGTSYWIHHLLFPNSLPALATTLKNHTASPSPRLLDALSVLPERLASLYNALPSTSPSAKIDPDQAFALHSLLSYLDPIMASRWHWKDTRKVLRNLEIIKESGRLASEVVADAHTANTTKGYRTLILWLYSEPALLNTRLEQRIDEMLSVGLSSLSLIATLSYSPCNCSKAFWMRFALQDVPHEDIKRPDFTLGVYQAIGYKELYQYVDGICDVDQQGFTAAVVEMKLNTKKYAQRQVKWIRNKLLPAVQACNMISHQKQGVSTISAYLLDATEVDTAWEANVLTNAKKIAESFLSGRDIPNPLTLSSLAHDMLSVPVRPMNPTEIIQSRRKSVCSVCSLHVERPVMLEEGREWEAHQRTRMHKRMLQRATQRV